MFPQKEAQANLAHMHQRDADGNLKEREHLFTASLAQDTKEKQDKFFQVGGAGLFAKPKEYVKILAAILNDGTSPTTGKQILKKETVDLLWKNQIPNQYVFPYYLLIEQIICLPTIFADSLRRPDFARNGPAPVNPSLINHVPEFYPQDGNPPQGWGYGGFLTISPGSTGVCIHIRAFTYRDIH